MGCGQRGFLLIAAIVLLVVGSMLAAAMAFMVATSGSSASDNLQSGQALFLADSGVEFEARRMAQNLDWYRSTTDPTAALAQNFGAGTITTNSNLVATMLRRRIPNGTSTADICVYTVDRFPTSGDLQIDDDIGGGAEFVRYTSTTTSSASCGNRPAFTGTITRNITIGGITGAAGSRERGDRVYPVTTLLDNIAASATTPCAAPAQLRITDHPKFLRSGTISLDDGAANSEDIFYANSSRAGGVMTLTGLRRLLAPPCPAWTAPKPVTPQLSGSSGGGPADFEAQAVAIGAVGNTQRTTNMLLQR
jgi:Tfp pilus assembly protein PilX